MNPLLIDIDDITESGRAWEADLPRDFIDEVLLAEPPTEFHAGGAAHVRARLTKLGKKLLVQSRFSVPLEGQCKRCLRKVALSERIELTLTFVPETIAAASAPRRPAAEERREEDWEGTPASFDRDTVDEEPYSGKQIDLAPSLREQILLAIPPPPLCKEDCQGLCPSCGKDLNEGDCACPKKRIDPRWEALKVIQLDAKEK